MKIINVEQNTDEWLALRKGKITGSTKLIRKRGSGELAGFYEVLAERLTIDDGTVDGRERGHELELEAVAVFSEEYDKEVDRVGFVVSDEDERIAVSPDGLIKNKGKYTEALEIKCLASKNHIQAIYEDKVPSIYDEQIKQYFVVIDELETLYFALYDPRFAEPLQLWVKEIKRSDVDIEGYKEALVEKLEAMDKFITEYTF